MAIQGYQLIGADEAPASKKNFKVVGYVVGAVAASVMFVAFIGGLNNSHSMASGASGPVALWAGVPTMSAGTSGSRYVPQLRQQTTPSRELQMYGISPSPLVDLAISAIDASNRGDQKRDVSMNAGSERISDWLPNFGRKKKVSYEVPAGQLQDPKTFNKFKKVLDQVEDRASLYAGVSAPMGYFDPLGFATTVSGGKLLFYREVELKHGRIAMLAALGILVGEQYHPLFGGDIDVPAYAAFQATPLQNFWPAVVTALAIPEVFSVLTFQDPSKGEQWAIREDHVPGDLGFDPLGLKPKDPKEFRDMQTKELNNGRLAMIAAAGMIAQEVATGQKLF